MPKIPVPEDKCCCQAELAVWRELDSVVSLAARLRLRALALPSGLLALRPPPSSESPSMFRSGQPAELPVLVCPEQPVPAFYRRLETADGV